MAELTEEDLAKMSPEQLRELQRQQCIFCHIISGKVPSRKVYEDERCLAVLDINPGAPGHLLLLPKEHVSILPQLPAEDMAHLGMVAKQLSGVLIKALRADGTTLLAANGVAAGQRAAHVMWHVIPRKDGDGVGLVWKERMVPDEQLHQVQERLIPAVRQAFGLSEDALVFERSGKQEGGGKKDGENGKEEPAKSDSQPPTPHVPRLLNSSTPHSQPPTSSLDDIANLLLRQER